jgi:hypothetical protein
MAGETGRMFQRIMDWCDGTAGGSGSVDVFLRKVEALADQIKKPVSELPDIREDWLLNFSGDEESVRVEVRKRYDNRKKKVQSAKESVDNIATNLAKEVLTEGFDHSMTDFLKAEGPIHQRLFYIRLIGILRERQKQAEDAFRAAEAALQGVDDSFSKYHDELVSTAKISLVEKVTGNKDYEQDAVPKFVKWFRDSVKKHQQASLLNDGLLDFFDDLVEGLVERLDRAAALFDDLLQIRTKLEGRCADLLKYGVPREYGGEATEHVLDVEIYQDHMDPDHARLWNWLFDSLEQPADYNAEEISGLIQQAQKTAKRRRHISEHVMNSLVAQGERLWDDRIRGKEKASDKHDLGLNIIEGIQQEAKWALAWEDIKRKYAGVRPRRLPADAIDAALDSVDEQRIRAYIDDKITHAASKCQPFLQFDPSGKGIPPKKYICVYKGYRDDDQFKKKLTNIQGFAITEGDLMITNDPKRVGFYWNEVGIPVYRVYSVDTYGANYETVKSSELSRGDVYEKKAIYKSGRPGRAEEVKLFGGAKCPDIPLHTDRYWEGVPDPYMHGLFAITQRAVLENRGRLHWEEHRTTRTAAVTGASDEVRLFTLAVFNKNIIQTDAGWVINNDNIKKESERDLGKWRDTAFKNLFKAKKVIQEWASDAVKEAARKLAADRDHAALEEYMRQLKSGLVGMEDNEVDLVKQELEVLEAEIKKIRG